MAYKLGWLLMLVWAGVAQAGEAGEAGNCHELLTGEHRSADNRARDRYRNPCETLAFFEVEPDHSVVEIWPGGGWYTEILAPLLDERGTLYAAHWARDSEVEYFRRGRARFDAKLESHPEVFDNVKVTVLEPPQALNMAPAGSVDRILTFRSVHNWLRSGAAPAVFEAAYRALRPGGLLGVVQHRARPDTTEKAMGETGYVTEDRVRSLARAAGFEFVAASEVNANAADDRDHPKGVWTLPPSLRLGDKDRQRYLAIGESDRMTLKFRKPE